MGKVYHVSKRAHEDEDLEEGYTMTEDPSIFIIFF